VNRDRREACLKRMLAHLFCAPKRVTRGFWRRRRLAKYFHNNEDMLISFLELRPLGPAPFEVKGFCEEEIGTKKNESVLLKGQNSSMNINNITANFD